MDRRLNVLLLVTTVLLVSGCAAPVASDERPVRTAADRPVSAGDHAVEPTAPTGALSSTVDDPAGAGAIVVSVEADGDRGPPVAAVRRAATYWERDDATGERTFVVMRDAPSPDVVVRVADEPVHCDGTDDLPESVCLFDDREGSGDAGPTLVAISPGLSAGGVQAAATGALGRIAGEPDPFARPDVDEPAFADPWPASDPVTIAVVDEAAADQDIEPLVRQTIAYWEEHDDRWGTYTADWRLVNGGDADLTVVLVDEVERCGDHPNPEKLLGCAPVLHPENLADDDERVRVKAGYDDETTLFVLKHEFGHVYGLSHGDEPADVMTTSISATRRR